MIPRIPQSSSSSGTHSPMRGSGGGGVIDFDGNTNNSGGDLLGTPYRSNRSNGDGNSGGGKLSSIADAVNLIESLRNDIDRIQTGLMLITMSVNKLMDIVHSNAANSSCCSQPFYYIESVFGLSSSSNTITNGSSSMNGVNDNSTHSSTNSTVSINRNVSGSYTITNTSLSRGSNARRNTNTNNKGNRITMPTPPSLQQLFGGGSGSMTSGGSKGYDRLEHRSTHSNHDLFTIGDDDEEEEISGINMMQRK